MIKSQRNSVGPRGRSLGGRRRIVFPSGIDPVKLDLVAGLTGGNITGVSHFKALRWRECPRQAGPLGLSTLLNASENDFDKAFAALARQRAGAVLITGDALLPRSKGAVTH